jgi:hypothetical protein
MGTPNSGVTYPTAGSVKLEIHADRKGAAAAAARAAAEELRRLDQLDQDVGVIFATGASQLDMLEALTSTQRSRTRSQPIIPRPFSAPIRGVTIYLDTDSAAELNSVSV